MPPRPASLKLRALQWLAQREHSRSELRAKLLRLLAAADRSARQAGDAATPVSTTGSAEAAAAPDDRPGQVDALLDWLQGHGHLSPSRFVESRVHARQARFGNLRIARELREHGLGLDATALQVLKDSELERARSVWLRKYGGPAENAAGRARQMRFLSGRGFSAEVILRVVRRGEEFGDDDGA